MNDPNWPPEDYRRLRETEGRPITKGQCPNVLTGTDHDGRCVLEAGHDNACTNGRATWTDPSNY